MLSLPTIETECLILRDLVEEDAKQMFEYNTDHEVSKYLFWSAHQSMAETVAEISRYKSSEQMMQWAITLKDNGKLIGVGGFGIVNKKMLKADLGYSFNPKYWNKGYATEMTKALIDYGFNQMKLVRIQGAVHPDNTASTKVLEKSGLHHEAKLKSWMIINNKPIDTLIYAIVASGY